MTNYLQSINRFITEAQFGQFDDMILQKKDILQKLTDILDEQVKGIREGHYKARNSQVMFTLILEIKDVVAIAARFIKLYHGIGPIEENL